MELTGEQIIPLPRDIVWKALNDPIMLSQCIPGCESFDLNAENQYRVEMQVAIGPIRAKFTGKLLLSDIVAPHSYKISFDGSGGVAGSGKGHAVVKLETVSEGTKLIYSVRAQVGGKLAQVGARLIDGVAKRMADIFFEKLKEKITLNEGEDNMMPESVPAPLPSQFVSRWLILAAIAAAAAVIYFVTR